jgi:hypothetical protein
MGDRYATVRVAAVQALTAEGARIHVMSWPNHFPSSGDPMRNRVAVDSQAFAQMSKAFVISACGTVDEDTIRKLALSTLGSDHCKSLTRLQNQLNERAVFRLRNPLSRPKRVL